MKDELQQLFDKYLPSTLLHCAKTFKHAITQVQICMISTMCALLENLINNNEIKALEYVFVFACVNCIGGCFTLTEGVDYRKAFSQWWKDTFKAIKFPGK